MSSNRLDQHFKDKLQNYSVPRPRDSWDRFAQAQHQKAIDQSIHDKLTALSTPVPPNSWQQFEEKLHATQLDNIAKQKLSTLGATIPPSNWEAFESKLEQSTQQIEQKFDSIFAATLNATYHVPFSIEHWQLMADRIDKEIIYPQELKQIKLLELSLMFLLIFALGKYAPIAESPLMPVGKTNTEIASKTTTSDSNLAVQQTDILAQNTTARRPIAQKIKQPISTPIKSSKTHTKRKKTTPIQLDENIITQRLETPLVFLPTSTTHDIQLPVASLSPLPTKDVGLLSLQESASSLGLSSILSKKDKSKWRFALVGGLDYNRIITPTLQVSPDLQVGFDRYTNGFSQGMSFALKHNKIAYELGLVYSSIQYDPLQLVYLEGSVQEGFYGKGFKYFEYNMIQLPLDLSYDYLSFNNWRMYVQGGIAWHAALTSSFYVADQTEFRSGKFQPQDTKLNEKDFTPEGVLAQELPKGAFEGGDLLDNSYISARMGLGVEYILGNRLSVFGQSNYGYSLYYFNRGLGPYKDVFHNFRLSVGLKINLDE